ncbi:uncharacterized protein ASCRUDRAFT_13554 [Ascoidea rubescens DSM 1968]|uniref:Uncharacterized protein n=1 Tax=Ascoidea rubescens DSM 1968 TaxID=1344418 RepID=A0A1D2VHW0_9ASCO|nr:hypothetical protein ASCRUDRAFT_13554 [Ascoidea rubescens DSM 1968]ODV61195.1 hypothetical protein ASCRUDRAFT_13554 [Ascoidea rubescens DSM 1968]
MEDKTHDYNKFILNKNKSSINDLFNNSVSNNFNHENITALNYNKVIINNNSITNNISNNISNNAIHNINANGINNNFIKPKPSKLDLIDNSELTSFPLVPPPASSLTPNSVDNSYQNISITNTFHCNYNYANSSDTNLNTDNNHNNSNGNGNNFKNKIINNSFSVFISSINLNFPNFNYNANYHDNTNNFINNNNTNNNTNNGNNYYINNYINNYNYNDSDQYVSSILNFNDTPIIQDSNNVKIIIPIDDPIILVEDYFDPNINDYQNIDADNQISNNDILNHLNLKKLVLNLPLKFNDIIANNNHNNHNNHNNLLNLVLSLKDNISLNKPSDLNQNLHIPSNNLELNSIITPSLSTSTTIESLNTSFQSNYSSVENSISFSSSSNLKSNQLKSITNIPSISTSTSNSNSLSNPLSNSNMNSLKYCLLCDKPLYDLSSQLPSSSNYNKFICENCIEIYNLLQFYLNQFNSNNDFFLDNLSPTELNLFKYLFPNLFPKEDTNEIENNNAIINNNDNNDHDSFTDFNLNDSFQTLKLTDLSNPPNAESDNINDTNNTISINNNNNPERNYPTYSLPKKRFKKNLKRFNHNYQNSQDFDYSTLSIDQDYSKTLPTFSNDLISQLKNLSQDNATYNTLTTNPNKSKKSNKPTNHNSFLRLRNSHHTLIHANSDWYLNVKKKLRWRWRVKGLLPQFDFLIKNNNSRNEFYR